MNCLKPSACTVSLSLVVPVWCNNETICTNLWLCPCKFNLTSPSILITKSNDGKILTQDFSQENKVNTIWAVLGWFQRNNTTRKFHENRDYRFTCKLSNDVLKGACCKNLPSVFPKNGRGNKNGLKKQCTKTKRVTNPCKSCA